MKRYWVIAPYSSKNEEGFDESWSFDLKNGENKKDYFGIKSFYPKDVLYTFYPDYLVKFEDGRLGVFETKDKGDQDGSTYTQAKSEALQEYIKKNPEKKLFGGVVIQVNNEWLINQQATCEWEKTLRNDWRDWKELKLLEV